MKTRRRLLVIIGCIALIFGAFFIATAAVGWWREKQDVKTIQALIRVKEAQIRSSIDKVGDGVPLDTFKKLLPSATYDDEDAEWTVKIPTGYGENPACINIFEKSVFFRLDGGMVKPVEDVYASGGSHADRFGGGRVWYYFWRAWYSSAEDFKRQQHHNNN